MEKIEIFEELKKNMCKALQVESRVSMGITSDNHYRKDTTQIPLEVQRSIDNVYKLLDEIASKYRVSTQNIGRLIQDGRIESKHVAEKGYKNKVEGQFEKVNVVLRQIENELNEMNKIDEQKNSFKLEDGMNGTRENKEIREKTVNNLNDNVKKIREEMQKTFNDRFFDPRRLREMQEETEMRLRSLQTGDKIEQSLVDEDKFTTKRIMRDFEKYASSINQTKHEKFVEEYQVLESELDIQKEDEIKEREQQKTQNKQNVMSLPGDLLR